MIRTHEFNSAWWGAEVGIVDAPTFFDRPDEDRRSELAPYRWAEFHVQSPESALVRKMHRAGFFFGDAQMEFRIRLRDRRSASAESLELENAVTSHFEVRANELRAFEGDRFLLLPRVTMRRVEERYARWSHQLISGSPATCLRATLRGKTQGWFLSAPSEKGLELTLAMLTKEATVSGQLLYASAIAAYARAGHAIGWAKYSYRHTAVANIYADLGARLTGARETWLWIAE